MLHRVAVPVHNNGVPPVDGIWYVGRQARLMIRVSGSLELDLIIFALTEGFDYLLCFDA